EDYESPKKKSIENELNKWKIQIRLEQDKGNPTVWYLNEGDVELFFETVPPGEDLIFLELFHFKIFVVCCCLIFVENLFPFIDSIIFQLNFLFHGL
ncbi:hypothetical protein RFI_02030, partial [Reticulomyxa filosa]